MSITDNAIRQADDAANPEWKAAADKIVRKLAKSKRTFTTDDVWNRLDKTGLATREPRAMGAVMRRAKGAGLIRSTGTFQVSARPECHRRPITVWSATEDAR